MTLCARIRFLVAALALVLPTLHCAGADGPLEGSSDRFPALPGDLTGDGGAGDPIGNPEPVDPTGLDPLPVDGTCSSSPETLWKDTTGVLEGGILWDLLKVGNTLYVAGAGRLQSLPTSGGEVTTHDSLAFLDRVAWNGDDLFWAGAVTGTADADLSLRTSSLTSLAIRDLATVPDRNRTWGMAADASRVYVGVDHVDGTELVSFSRTGGAQILHATVSRYAHSLVSNATHLYWTDWTDGVGISGIKRVAKTGGEVEVISGSAPPRSTSFGRLVLTDTHIYFAVSLLKGLSFVPRLARMRLDGSGFEELGPSSSPEGFQVLAVHGDALYYIAGTSTGRGNRLARMPLSGGAETIMAFDLERSEDLLVDDACVYWLTRKGVYRMAR